jgi:hypothetical protein
LDNFPKGFFISFFIRLGYNNLNASNQAKKIQIIHAAGNIAGRGRLVYFGRNSHYRHQSLAPAGSHPKQPEVNGRQYHLKSGLPICY